MLGAGTVINPLVKILTTIVVLGASYLFIVKPILDTTDEAINSAGVEIKNASADTANAFQIAELQQCQARIDSFAQSLQSSWPAAAREVRSCARQAGDELAAVRQCDNQAEKLVQSVLSDRSFSLSYATSLNAQGNGDAANRVQQCVKNAGFAPAAMQRCRNLANQLLFG